METYLKYMSQHQNDKRPTFGDKWTENWTVKLSIAKIFSNQKKRKVRLIFYEFYDICEKHVLL